MVKITQAIKRTGELGSTKNCDTRNIPIKPEVLEFLETKIDKRAGYILGDANFVSKAGFESRYKHFFNRLRKHLEVNGEESVDYKPPHALRRTCATNWHKSGMPIGIISKLLGHGSIAVTEKYLGLGDIDTLMDAVDKYAPAW
jgi:integrase